MVLNLRPVRFQRFDGTSDHGQAERFHSRRYQATEPFNFNLDLIAPTAHVHPAAWRREQSLSVTDNSPGSEKVMTLKAASSTTFPSVIEKLLSSAAVSP